MDQQRARVVIAFWLLATVIGGLLLFLAAGTVGSPQTLRFAVGMALALALAWLYMRFLLRRAPPRPAFLADMLTLSRLVCACALAGYVVSGVLRTGGLISWVVWALVIYAASISDWFDGPIARRFGESAWGKPLDIESDSWLTLWCALGAIFLGGLPWFVVVPPLLHYAFPVIEISAGNLPKGGKPDWSRVTGIAQMVLLIGALAPVSLPWRETFFAYAAWPVSGAQFVTMLVLLWRRLHQVPPHAPAAAPAQDTVDAGHSDGA